MAINMGKVVTGGLVAGLVMNICDFLTNTYIMAAGFKTEMDALNPALMAKMEGGSAIAKFVVLDFIFGLLIVWTYAAIRPRFGAGAGTAIKAALLVWLVSALTWYFTVAMGVFSMGFFMKSAVLSLVTMVIAGYVGAMLYKEE